MAAQLFSVGRLTQDTEGIRRITSTIESLVQRGEREADISLPLADLIDTRANHGYYAYAGGLTTPDCTPPVTWVVMSKVKLITQRALDTFKLVSTQEGGRISEVGNVRPLQSRGVRQVYHWGESRGERLDGCCALGLGGVGRCEWVETAQMARVETRTASSCASDRVFLTRRGESVYRSSGPA